METHADKSSLTLAWTAAILLIVLCGGGVAVMMGWIPTSFGNSPHPQPAFVNLAPPIARVPASAAVACSGCGVVKSVRKVKMAVKRTVPGSGPVASHETQKPSVAPMSFEVTVHLDDGSNHVVTETDTPSWRFGDKVRIVNGVIQPNA